MLCHQRILVLATERTGLVSDESLNSVAAVFENSKFFHSEARAFCAGEARPEFSWLAAAKHLVNDHCTSISFQRFTAHMHRQLNENLEDDNVGYSMI